jgi:alpha-tubulin N-acetyltransferase 1
MEFNFNCTHIFKCDNDGIVILNGNSIPKSIHSYICIVLDSIGLASSKAQGLKSAITTGIKFIKSDHKIFLVCDGKLAIGFLKVGKKNLFIRNALGEIKEINPLCVLDFYVHENQQRSGYGKVS